MRDNNERLRELGEALFGPRWQTDVSRALGVTDRTVRDWVSGKTEVRDRILVELLAHARERERELEEIIGRIEDEIGTSQAPVPGI